MFVRKKPNASGSVSVQVIDKSAGYRVVETIGSARDPQEIARLVELGKLFIARRSGQYSLFPADPQSDAVALDVVRTLENASIRTLGPELILGRLFDAIGFDAIPEPLFRDIVIARLAYPTSKLKTVDYLYRYRGKTVCVQEVYRFLDRLNSRYAEQAQRIAYEHSRTILGSISVVFYDMTSLYFEAEDEDDLRRIGFSKDGKFQSPQIMLGLLVGRAAIPSATTSLKATPSRARRSFPCWTASPNGTSSANRSWSPTPRCSATTTSTRWIGSGIRSSSPPASATRPAPCRRRSLTAAPA
jgi:hypothetical protein